MGTALPKLCNGSRDDVDKIEINVKNGKQITFGGYDLETVIQKLAVNISKFIQAEYIMIWKTIWN